jgi:hypothetical protein
MHAMAVKPSCLNYGMKVFLANIPTTQLEDRQDDHSGNVDNAGDSYHLK